MQPHELRATRKAMKITQGDLGAAIGMTATAIGMMERGEMDIAPRTAFAVLYLSEHPEQLQGTPAATDCRPSPSA